MVCITGLIGWAQGLCILNQTIAAPRQIPKPNGALIGKRGLRRIIQHAQMPIIGGNGGKQRRQGFLWVQKIRTQQDLIRGGQGALGKNNRFVQIPL